MAAITRLGGWWRLWIAVTAIYGAVVGAFTWQTLPRVENTPYDANHLRRMSDRSLEILAGQTRSPQIQDNPKWKDAPIILEMPNGHSFEVHGNTPNEQFQDIAKDYVKVLGSVVDEKRTVTIQHAFLLWLIPCLIVLTLGWGVGCVCRGFKQRTE